MAYKRTFKLDTNGEMVETTPERVRKVCDQLEAGCEPIRKHLDKKGKINPRGRKYPYPSENMAIEPEQIGEQQEILRSHGVQTDYTRTGEPLITGPEHERRHAQALGFYDRSGTWSPRNR
jgi:hypothetical protein